MQTPCCCRLQLATNSPKRKCIRFGFFYFVSVLCFYPFIMGKEPYSKCGIFFTPKLITTFLNFQVCMHFKMFAKCKVLHQCYVHNLCPFRSSCTPIYLCVSITEMIMVMVMVSTWALLTDKRNTTWNLTSTLSGRYKSKELGKKIDQYILPCINIRTGYLQLSIFNFSAQSTISPLRFFFATLPS